MRRVLVLFLTALTVPRLPLLAQMHKVATPEDVVRAVGVYEWTGDREKPAASRLIPVSIFIDGKLEDAAVYLARPIPLALDAGTLYEVDKAGVSEGTVDLKYASHLNTSGPNATDQADYFDDGWFGYGTYAAPPPQKKTATLPESKRPSQIVSSKADTAKPDPDRPSFSRKPDAGPAPDATQTSGSPTPGSPSSGSQTPASQTSASSAGATRPADSSTKNGSSTTKADDDPDRPQLIRKPEPTTTPDSSGTSGTSQAGTAPAGNVPADDPDRPTLKKRTPEEAKKARKESQESSARGLATSLNDDPNRPTLHRGKGQQDIPEESFPKLKGVPSNLHQAVAVSDAKTRPAHDFSRPWTDAAEKATILAKMQEMARAQIAAYRSTAGVPPAAPQSAAAATGSSGARRTPNSKLRHAKAPTDASSPLLEEEIKGYTLSYGGAATYIYTAHTAGEGATLMYVTIVAQMNALGALEPAMQSVTDAAHLDRTPWMRLVDVVDAEASNRASLLFELRESSSRQFALYRVIAARSEQTFLTGTTQ